jgi:hypothetical protein
MAAVPRFSIPSAPVSPAFAAPSRRPSAAILRFRRPGVLTPVVPDPSENRLLAPATAAVSDVAASWVVVMAIAVLGFALS